MPSMRACIAKAPTTRFTVAITKVGAKTPDSVRDRPIYRTPAAGVKVTAEVANNPAGDAGRTCVEAAAARIALPMPKERDT